MHQDGIELNDLLWSAGWLVAMLVLFVAGLRLPLQMRSGGTGSRVYAGACVVAGIAVWLLGNVALTLHDTHIDLTHEKVYTPSPAALRVAAELATPVTITYFYRAQ